ncbi:MAG TPA: alcohol dehydrogenase catalytic domain-containing protein [Candidatus Dormibacteraeota bacterium]|nr:alcohol dehydrogenase catalytic domain-containing protein [Candidatus Dormibacteraeota bacterium]
MSRTGVILEAATTQAGKLMHAGVYRGKGRVEVEQVAVPEVSSGEVLIRVAACGICGTDIKKIFHGLVEPPQILGHEIAGTVVEVGRGVTQWKPGDRVMSFHHVPCGSCFYCERQLYSQCPGYKKTGLTAGFTPNGGGFAEYVKAMPRVAEHGIVAIPPGITFEEATFIEPVNTMVKAVEKARVAAREKILVIGQGPVGLLLMMLSKLAGAIVLVSDPMAERRSKSLQMGADAAFDPSAGTLLDEVRAGTEGRGADCVIVATSYAHVLSEALAAARPGGRVLLFAQNDPVLKLEFSAAAVGIEEKEILGSYSASVDIQKSVAEMIFSRRLPVAGLVTHRFPLDRIQQALELTARPTSESLKVLITYS